MPSRTATPPAPLWRLMLVIVGLFWILAAFVFVITQWIAPALTSGTPTGATSFNYGQAFAPFVKTFGLVVAGVLVVLGPFAAVWQALVRGGEAVMDKALGSSNRRGRR
ncbi:MAG TPA: hypothetical protein VGG90_01265 [Candidatus Dormibacteraeota bacterium]